MTQFVYIKKSVRKTRKSIGKPIYFKTINGLVRQLEPLAARAFLIDFIVSFPGQVFCFDN
jgi:hypothetical protein